MKSMSDYNKLSDKEREFAGKSVSEISAMASTGHATEATLFAEIFANETMPVVKKPRKPWEQRESKK